MEGILLVPPAIAILTILTAGNSIRIVWTAAECDDSFTGIVA